MDWIVQALPLYRSASATSLEWPTAAQAVDEVHETAVSTLSPDPFEMGVGLIVHDLPFHASASVATDSVLKLNELPTERHLVDEGHDTPDKTLDVAPAGWGLASTFHFLPFHNSASVTSSPLPLWVSPTAVHADAEAQETASSSLLVLAATFGAV